VITTPAASWTGCHPPGGPPSAGDHREAAEQPHLRDRHLTGLHRNSERWHLAALLISSSPFGSAVTDELLVKLEATIYPEWMRARLTTPVRYLSNHSHRLRMLAFIDDKSNDVATFVIQGLGHPSYSTTSTRRSATGSARSGRPEPAKMYALSMSGSLGLLAIARPRRRHPGRRRVPNGGWSRDPRSSHERSLRSLTLRLMGVRFGSGGFNPG
jgi:hypothetical protein